LAFEPAPACKAFNSINGTITTMATFGYQSQIIFDMPTNNPNWQGGVNTNYYFHLPDGKYGRMNFQFLPWNGVITIHGLINPTGSRNLEPAQ
jgi:hypothetical protein